MKKILILFSLMLLPYVALAQLSGAIFTSTYDGQMVNGNVYPDKNDVYLNGGPQPNAPPTASGLPNGEYYFQVTDPSGAILLSDDDISERKFRVSGGKITEYLGATHLQGTGSHPGSISIQLMPYLNTPNSGGEYKVWATPVDRYNPASSHGSYGFLNQWSKTDNFKVRETGNTAVMITGHKWYDFIPDGIWDQNHQHEVTIEGFRVEVFFYDESNGLIESFVTETGGSGVWSAIAPEGSVSFEACELLPAGSWVQTAPSLGTENPAQTAVADEHRCWTGVLNGQDITDLDFGNVYLGHGGGRTLGFWSNKNGEGVINDNGGSSSELLMLRELNLRKDNGTVFDPVSYNSAPSASAFRPWLLGATASNMAYMLSAQLSAMALNVEAGFVSGSSYVYVSGNGTFMTIDDLMADANTSLGTYGLTVTAGPIRDYQEMLKNALDGANNNFNFVVIPPGWPMPLYP